MSSGLDLDQYHTFTARLAANGYQTTFTRMFAACILGLGFSAALAAAFPRATDRGQAWLAILALVSVLCAVPWLRHRWPSRTESASVVALGTLALAAGCLIPADPMSGLLVAVGFALILGYTALLHSFRLLLVPMTVGAATASALAFRIATHSVATAVAVTIPLVMLCGVVTYACRTIAVVGGSSYAPAEIEPVTGLLTRDSFDQGVATLLGTRHRDDDRHFVVVAAGVDGLSAIAGVHGARGANRSLVDAGRAIRETARNGAIVSHLGDGEFLIADTFTFADPTPLVERVLGVIAATPTRMTASVGVVSTPLNPLAQCPPQSVLDETVALAVAAMAQARAAGGNQARYVIAPKLSDDGVADDGKD